MNHYEVLGVAPDASPVEVRRAYVAKARAHHPDFHAATGGSERARSERQMQLVNDAWHVLGDPSRRADYDRTLSSARPSLSTARPSPPRRTASGASVHFRPLDPDPDDGDAFDESDVPFERPGRTPPRWMVLAPPAAVAGGLGLVVLGLVVSLRAVVALGVLGVALGAVGFLLAPFYAMTGGHGPRR